MGFRGKVARSTLADANESHDWRIFADFAQLLIGIARPLYARDPMRRRSGPEPATRWTRPPSTCACPCFRGPSFGSAKRAVKMHTLLDLHGNIPTFIRITSGKVHDVNILDEICRRLGPSTSWTAATSISQRLFVLHAQRGLLRRAHQIAMFCCSGATHIRWTRATGVRSRSDRHPDGLRIRHGVSGCVCGASVISMRKPASG